MTRMRFTVLAALIFFACALAGTEAAPDGDTTKGKFRALPEVQVDHDTFLPAAFYGTGKVTRDGRYIRESCWDWKKPAFFIFDMDGNAIASATVEIQDSLRIYIHGYDGTTGGGVVFCGQSESIEKGWEPFVGWVSGDGSQSKVVKTAPYFCGGLASAPDGSFWTIGQDMIDFNPHAPGLDYDGDQLLRHFDRNGQLAHFSDDTIDDAIID